MPLQVLSRHLEETQCSLSQEAGGVKTVVKGTAAVDVLLEVVMVVISKDHVGPSRHHARDIHSGIGLGRLTAWAGVKERRFHGDDRRAPGSSRPSL